jgi:hypothetical protein
MVSRVSCRNAFWNQTPIPNQMLKLGDFKKYVHVFFRNAFKKEPRSPNRTWKLDEFKKLFRELSDMHFETEGFRRKSVPKFPKMFLKKRTPNPKSNCDLHDFKESIIANRDPQEIDDEKTNQILRLICF